MAESRSAASSDTDVYGVRRYRRELRDPVVDWWPSGWLLLAGLFLLFVVGMFFIAPAIQRSAQNAVVEALEAAGFTVAEVGGSGQRVAVDLDTLGNPTRALEQARAVARGAQCPSWAGALICPTRVTVSARTPMLPAGDTGPSTAATNPVPAASTETGPESGSSTAEARAPSRPHDFELRRDGERWTLRGETPDADTRLWLLARLRAAHPSVQAELEVTETAATPLFRPAAQAALKVLEPLERGVVRWSAGSLSLEGLVTEARQAEAEAGYAALSAELDPQPLALTIAKSVDVCATEFATALNESTINFASASASLDRSSDGLLDRLAALAEQCAGDLVIEGHTDDSGAASKNLILSQARADSVRAALIERGIGRRRLSAKGFGEDQPIADNATPEGRAKNRRIVVRLAEQESSFSGA